MTNALRGGLAASLLAFGALGAGSGASCAAADGGGLRLAQTDRSQVPLDTTATDPNAASGAGPTGGLTRPAPRPGTAGTAGTSGLVPGPAGTGGSVSGPATTDTVTGGTTGIIDGAGASMIDCPSGRATAAPSMPPGAPAPAAGATHPCPNPNPSQNPTPGPRSPSGANGAGTIGGGSSGGTAGGGTRFPPAQPGTAGTNR